MSHANTVTTTKLIRSLLFIYHLTKVFQCCEITNYLVLLCLPLLVNKPFAALYVMYPVHIWCTTWGRASYVWRSDVSFHEIIFSFCTSPCSTDASNIQIVRQRDIHMSQNIFSDSVGPGAKIISACCEFGIHVFSPHNSTCCWSPISKINLHSGNSALR